MLFRKNRITPAPVSSSLESRIQLIGRELLERARSLSAGAFTSKFWNDQLMGWTMKDPAFKVQLFRFIDTLPTLHSNNEIYSHLKEYLIDSGVSLPPGMSTGIKAGTLMKGMLTRTIQSQVDAMARRFIAGDSPEDALKHLRQRWDQSIAFSADLLGEACLTTEEARVYEQRYLELIEFLSNEATGWPARDVLERDHVGDVPRVNVSIKISSLCPRIRPVDPDGTIALLLERLGPILTLAGQKGVFINFDMEHHALKELTIRLFKECCSRFDFPAGIAIQGYLKTAEANAADIIEWARESNRQITVRLIKGAYWDYETIRADMMNWPSPIWPTKAETDACFERVVAMFVDAMPKSPGEPGVKLALGSHNLRSIAAALAMLEDRGLPTNAIEMQMLYGMAEELKLALVGRGLRVREYSPVGAMLPGMAYLVRRLLENTSNESWLRAGFIENASPEALLAPPVAAMPASPFPVGATLVSPSSRREMGDTSVAPTGETSQEATQASRLPWGRRHGLTEPVEGFEPFETEPQRDFSNASQRETFGRAIQKSSVPKVRIDVTPAQANAAVERAANAFPDWRDTPVLDRARLLQKAAAILREHRDEYAGVVILESGKPWVEADADVCEAIDFCEYYARQAVALMSPRRLGKFAGELNLSWHEGRGPTAVISPWNFPLAICCGMTVAALVTGNTVLVKPAEQTPGIAKILVDVLHRAGVPKDVVQLTPGEGETIGAMLVRDPRIANIAFTGSKAVGLDILGAAGVTQPGQKIVKRVVCEMGGKNAIIVDSSADPDDSVLGVRDSAFSYAGQKCSACSRVIVLDSIHDAFVERLVKATGELRVGDPMLPETDMGPVIDDAAAEKIRKYIEIGRAETGEPALSGQAADGEVRGKPLIHPVIFTGVKPQHRIASEEIFGPVLSVIRASSFDEAIELANASDYKLTGGVFSRTPSHLLKAQRDFRVGNLYLNRAITGALVGRQPFGGFGLSGGGTKAGGAEYLLHFVDPRVCTESSMRRGFAPEEPHSPPST